MRDSDRLTPDQKRDRLRRRGKRATSMVLTEPSAFVPIKRRLSPEKANARLVARVRRRRELEGADWMKQMRRQQRTLSSGTRDTPEQKIALAIKNGDDKHGPIKNEIVRYKEMPTPEQLDAVRVKDTRSGKQR